MYSLKIFLKLLLHTFTFKRNSLRFISFKRLTAVFILYPLFTFFFLVNWFFLLLDELIFFSYRKTKLLKTAFIIGVPRSATTHLFNLLNRDTSNFHGFKLWELAFAPSICQKYMVLFVRLLDYYCGKPIFRASLLFDRLVFGKFRGIHDIGLTKFEEDEALFLYNFSSLYLFYFYPELPFIENLLKYDEKVPDVEKEKHLRFYYRCIQRHVYVFDRTNKKYFLSKNPTFIPKMESIARRFENARFIYPLRNPFRTIPSTISLNAHIYSVFSNCSGTYPLVGKTSDMILEWYEKADKVIKNLINERAITVFYNDIVKDPVKVVEDVYQFLGLELMGKNELVDFVQKRAFSYRSPHKYPQDLGIDKEKVIKRLGNIIPPEILEGL